MLERVLVVATVQEMQLTNQVVQLPLWVMLVSVMRMILPYIQMIIFIEKVLKKCILTFLPLLAL